MKRLALAIALAVLALAAPRPAAAEPGDEITISVLTFGPGSHPFDKFGHQAIRVRDAQDRVYNFGTYRFDSAALIPTFFLGRFRYWLSARGYNAAIRPYVRADRSIEEQELNLTAAQKLEIKRKLEINLRPENRYYKYDYYLDNCATRIRDVIDDAIGGRIREASRDPAPLTFRQHTQRLTADNVPVYTILHLIMGPLIDRPIDRWEEMFLPAKLQEGLRRVTVVGPEGEAPLVKAERVIHASSRPSPAEAPPGRMVWFALVGATIGGALAWLGAAARTRRGPRIALGTLLAVLGFVAGFFGVFFLLVWMFTDHAVGYRNENALQLAPWAFGLVGYGIGLARGKARAIRIAAMLAAACAGASLLGLLLKVAPPFSQQNGDFIALALPLWGGAAAGTWLLRKAAGKA